MTENRNNENNRKPFTLPSRDEWHHVYGGNITEEDFNIGDKLTLSDMASKIRRDESFDSRCINNIRYRDKEYSKGDFRDGRV